ncbi:MAG: hypothetical protein MH204_06880, partial [Fimbriimonadaceae bacterium]|nr:hypothetical protein [Fimbriimonadaceae bacterium]
NRDSGDIAPQSSIKTTVPGWAFLTGPATVQFDGNPAASRTDPALASRLADGGAQISAQTGEMLFQRGRRTIVINAPSAQGAASFWSGEIRTRDMTFRSSNRYGAVAAVSLDDRPLATSEKILIQYGTQVRPTGWQDKPVRLTLSEGVERDGFEVVNYGRAPWRVKKAAMDFTLANSRVKRMRVLDEQMMEVSVQPLASAGAGRVRGTFPEAAISVVLTP